MVAPIIAGGIMAVVFILAASLFGFTIFAITDWWEIIILGAMICFIVYMYYTHK